jgi:hypothetical protein
LQGLSSRVGKAAEDRMTRVGQASRFSVIHSTL